uniref:Uncharacterized protein n=1 Tax=Romanomermis culicivorax TaxID=13658 RepID=A0A915HTT8_ROMCU
MEMIISKLSVEMTKNQGIENSYPDARGGIRAVVRRVDRAVAVGHTGREVAVGVVLVVVHVRPSVTKMIRRRPTLPDVVTTVVAEAAVRHMIVTTTVENAVNFQPKLKSSFSLEYP